MYGSKTYLSLALLAFASTASAAGTPFTEDPFGGTGGPEALATPGRQIVAPQRFVQFNIATDVLAFDFAQFGITELSFANDLSTNLPTSGINFIVLQNGAPLAAGSAADAIAAQLTESRPGFFIYFNSGLQLPRLVFSTDLSDPTADLSVLARFTNLTGPGGFAQMPDFTAANVTETPEPSSILLMLSGAALISARAWKRRRTQ